MMDPRQIIQQKYRPQTVKYLFIAEAYPCTEGQFFYYEQVSAQDNLFMYLIRAVFPDLKSWEPKEIRRQKPSLLQRFCDEGYFLDYSVAGSIAKEATASQSVKIITQNIGSLLVRLEPFRSANIILISANVYKLCYQPLVQNGFNILNTEAVPYPGSGQQSNFARAMFQLGF